MIVTEAFEAAVRDPDRRAALLQDPDWRKRKAVEYVLRWDVTLPSEAAIYEFYALPTLLQDDSVSSRPPPRQAIANREGAPFAPGVNRGGGRTIG